MPQRRSIYIYYKEEPKIQTKLESLRDFLIQNGFYLVDHHKNANIIVSIGGDGDFLQAVRWTGFRDDCLYVGIETNDQLSFYSDFHLDHLDNIQEALQSDQLKVRRYPTIEVIVDDKASYYCLNEFSIQSAIVKTFVLDVYLNDLHFETFRGDGLIISTPTGSSGYNKSVNGALVDPKLPCIQITELGSLNNNRYRTIGTSIIINQDKVITLRVGKEGNEHPIMAVDNEALGKKQVEKVQIRLSNKVIKTLKLKDNSFFYKVKRTFL